MNHIDHACQLIVSADYSSQLQSAIGELLPNVVINNKKSNLFNQLLQSIIDNYRLFTEKREYVMEQLEFAVMGDKKGKKAIERFIENDYLNQTINKIEFAFYYMLKHRVFIKPTQLKHLKWREYNYFLKNTLYIYFIQEMLNQLETQCQQLDPQQDYENNAFKILDILTPIATGVILEHHALISTLSEKEHVLPYQKLLLLNYRLRKVISSMLHVFLIEPSVIELAIKIE